MLLPNPKGCYHFLPGIDAYSSGVAAYREYEIVHVTLPRPVPLHEGFARIDAHLRDAGRGRHALCGIELRSPRPFTRAGFIEFNAGYCALLRERDVLLDGHNPIARTNVAPRWNPPPVPSVYAFSYTRPAPPGTPKTFVVAGAGDLRAGPLREAAVVRAGETSTDAMREKMTHVMEAMARRLDGLGVTWEAVTAINVYTVEPIESLLGPVILQAVGPAAGHGIRWYPARPPIDELAFEMDVRGVREERVL